VDFSNNLVRRNIGCAERSEAHRFAKDAPRASAHPIAIKRNQARFMLVAMAYNIKRGVAVQAERAAMTG
jgi:hypothetical protein